MALHKIYSNLSSEKLHKMLPAILRHRYEQNDFSSNIKYVLVLFPVDEKVVVRSPDIRKAINDIENDLKNEQVVVAGNKFSQEASELVETNGYILLAMQTDYWTDDSIVEIRISIAKKH